MKGNNLEENLTGNTIDFLLGFCYNLITLPPIFRDGVRGGNAASAVLKWGKT